MIRGIQHLTPPLRGHRQYASPFHKKSASIKRSTVASTARNTMALKIGEVVVVLPNEVCDSTAEANNSRRLRELHVE